MAPVEDLDVVEQAPRASWSRRRQVTVLVVVATLAVGLYLADQRAYATEKAALSQCASGAERAVVSAGAPVHAMVGYTRPTLEALDARGLRGGLLAGISKEAVGRDAMVVEARRDCVDIPVLWTHSDLRAQREACLAGLTAHADQLRAVAQDGRAAFTSWPSGLPGC
jgi:hypothetical protein